MKLKAEFRWGLTGYFNEVNYVMQTFPLIKFLGVESYISK